MNETLTTVFGIVAILVLLTAFFVLIYFVVFMSKILIVLIGSIPKPETVKCSELTLKTEKLWEPKQSAVLSEVYRPSSQPVVIEKREPEPEQVAPVETIECGHCHNEIMSEPVFTELDGEKVTLTYKCEHCSTKVVIND